MTLLGSSIPTDEPTEMISDAKNFFLVATIFFNRRKKFFIATNIFSYCKKKNVPRKKFSRQEKYFFFLLCQQKILGIRKHLSLRST